jgi:ABC-type sugar transport system permease subunit
VILACSCSTSSTRSTSPTPSDHPDNATLTPVVYIYQLGFQQDAFGSASAVAWVLFVIIFVFTLAQFRPSALTRR